jgi:hypothetical protein
MWEWKKRAEGSAIFTNPIRSTAFDSTFCAAQYSWGTGSLPEKRQAEEVGDSISLLWGVL